MSINPEAMLSDAAVRAAVGALASRNSAHLDSMNEQEQQQALQHWHELVLDVLTAARAAINDEEQTGPIVDGELPGRAVIVLQDAGGEDVTVHATFHPELEDMGNEEVGGTPAQITAVMLLQSLSGEDDEDEGQAPPA